MEAKIPSAAEAAAAKCPLGIKSHEVEACHGAEANNAQDLHSKYE